MLAATMKSSDLVKFPLIASPKLDGIRIVIHPELGPVTRSLKPIPNLYIRNKLNALECLKYLDGEIIVGNPKAHDAFNVTQSAVMSSSGEPQFTFVVFDSFEHPEQPYTERIKKAAHGVTRCNLSNLGGFSILIENRTISDLDTLEYYESDMVGEGYEGIMIRQPEGPYKFGRSTERAGTLVKIKQFSDSEAIIVGYEFLQHNDNEAKTNVFGRTERSSHKAGKRENIFEIGALIVKGINGKFKDVTFKIGTGFTQKMRQDLSLEGEDLIGKTVNYVYQEEGSKDAPRFPRFNGFRDPDTMDA